jgi:hypothetical protein
MIWNRGRSQCGHCVKANVSLYNGEQYSFVFIVAGGWDIVQSREERIFACYRRDFPQICGKQDNDIPVSVMSTAFLMELRTLGEPLF